MDIIYKTIITGLLTVVFIWGGGATKAYTPDVANRALVYHPHNIMVDLQTYKG